MKMHIEKTARGFTPLDSRDSTPQAGEKKNVSAKADKNQMFRGGNLTGFTPLDSRDSTPQAGEKKNVSAKADKNQMFQGGNLTGFTLLELIITFSIILIIVVIAGIFAAS